MKQRKIISMFDSIANTYDIGNRCISFGLDRVWRRKTCALAYRLYNKNRIHSIVDIACGTGDMLQEWYRQAEKEKIKVDRFIGVDPSKEMLRIARGKAGIEKFIKAEGGLIPLKWSSTDIVSISYGLRNIVEVEKALGEFHRILKRGGFLVVLEFFKEKDESLISKMATLYTKKALPLIGGFISKDHRAYNYLPTSIDAFFTLDRLIEILEEIGFQIRATKNFSFNISGAVIAEKI